MDYHIDFGDGFAQQEWEIESKGWFDTRVRIDHLEFTISFYDPIRLAQEVQAALDSGGLFFEKCIVVIPKVNRENIEKAVEAISMMTKSTS